jgi:hypothetical protein
LAKPAEREMTWEDAVLAVLQAAEGALRYTEIAERISSEHLKRKVGANPASSVAATLSRSLADVDSPFQKVGKGEYTLKANLQKASSQAATVEPDQISEDSDTGALRAFGMFWQRIQVNWTSKPRLLGRQQVGASEVNFSDQVGVYLLHDRDRVIYVGRASDTLYARLRAHTTDRLGGRWDRFSWFGLRSVSLDGSLTEPSAAWSHTVVIATLEALLIESLEPPLNRKRGDSFSGVEYLQVIDPELEASREKQVIAKLMRQAGISDG